MEEFIEGICRIANHKAIIDKLEPNVMSHINVENWMVKRILYAERLLEDELSRNTGRAIQE